VLLKKAYAANHKLQAPKDKQIPISKSQIRAKANYLLTHSLELFFYFAAMIFCSAASMGRAFRSDINYPCALVSLCENLYF